MSSRVAAKQRLRAQREAREREAALREQRVRRLRVASTAALAVVALMAVAALASTRGDSGDVSRGSGGAFGQHYSGLQQRREATGVSTMSAPTASIHIHPQLTVWANGKRVGVPANIGIEPGRPPGDMASLHTHTPDGVIHDEGQGNAQLGQFFAVWGVPFSADRPGPYRARGGKVVQVWVDGKPSRAFGELKLQDGQRIVVSFGKPSERPAAS